MPDHEFLLQEVREIPPDYCLVNTIELSLPGYNYRAPFTSFKWKDWGDGLEVNWTDGGRIMYFTFPNHRICQPQFRICTKEDFQPTTNDCNCDWQPILDCPRNNSLTVHLDACLYGQETLFVHVYLLDEK
jgi:hypothetical protein